MNFADFKENLPIQQGFAQHNKSELRSTASFGNRKGATPQKNTLSREDWGNVWVSNVQKGQQRDEEANYPPAADQLSTPAACPRSIFSLPPIGELSIPLCGSGLLAPPSSPAAEKTSSLLPPVQTPNTVVAISETAKARLLEAFSSNDPLAVKNVSDIPYIVHRVNRVLYGKSTQTEDTEAALDSQRYKSVLCRNWQSKHECPYEERCVYAHGYKELRSVQQNIISIAHVMPLIPKDPSFIQSRLAMMSVPPTPPRMVPHSAQKSKLDSSSSIASRRAVRFDPPSPSMLSSPFRQPFSLQSLGNAPCSPLYFPPSPSINLK